MDIRTVLIIFHVIGTALGAGAATVSDYLFFHFAKDKKVERHEFRILQTVSDIVWAGLLILVLSGFGFVLLYLSGHESARTFYNLDKIYAKTTVVIILLLNGFVLHRQVLPLFKKRLGKPFVTPAFTKKSPIVFTAGAISAGSWYTALVLGAWRGLTATYTEIMLCYIVVLCIGILISNIGGHAFLTQKPRKTKKRSRAARS